MYGVGAAQSTQLRVCFFIVLFSYACGVAYSQGNERGVAAISAGRFGDGSVMLRLAAFLCGLLVAFDTALPIGVNLRTADLVSVNCLGLFCWTLLAGRRTGRWRPLRIMRFGPPDFVAVARSFACTASAWKNPARSIRRCAGHFRWTSRWWSMWSPTSRRLRPNRGSQRGSDNPACQPFDPH